MPGTVRYARRRPGAKPRVVTTLVPLGFTTTSGVGGPSFIDLLTQFRADLGIVSTQGYKIRGIHGWISCSFITAPGAGTAGELVVAATVCDSGLTAAQTDPSALTATGRSFSWWAWSYWASTQVANTVANQNVFAAFTDKRLSTPRRSSRMLRDQSDQLRLCIGASPAASTGQFSFTGRLKLAIQLP